MVIPDNSATLKFLQIALSRNPTLADQELQHRSQQPYRSEHLAGISQQVGGTKEAVLTTDKATRFSTATPSYVVVSLIVNVVVASVWPVWLLTVPV
jgi:hypothetical protein